MPSIILEINKDEAESPTTFRTVAPGSIIVAIIVKIGRAATGNPRSVNIIISEIVPPPTGIAVTRNVANRETNTIFPILISELNKYTKNIILKALPMIEPSLWKFVPIGIIDSAISSDTPIFFVASILTGMDAADEQVARAVMVGGKTF